MEPPSVMMGGRIVGASPSGLREAAVRRFLFVSVAALAALGTSLLGGAFVLAASDVPALPAADESVEAVNFQFQPQTITVPAGTTITWTNNGTVPHTVTADDGSFDSGTLQP